MWGEESLTLLCPTPTPAEADGEGAGLEEPYVLVPELVQKVFHYRAYVSVQQRSLLGVVVHPATSFQIYALRARGCVDASAGKLCSPSF